MNKQLLAFNVMAAVQSSYTAEGMTDSEFAKKLTAVLKMDVTTARVRQARLALGIPNSGAKESEQLTQAKELLKSAVSTLSESNPLKLEINKFLGLEWGTKQ